MITRLQPASTGIGNVAYVCVRISDPSNSLKHLSVVGIFQSVLNCLRTGVYTSWPEKHLIRTALPRLPSTDPLFQIQKKEQNGAE